MRRHLDLDLDKTDVGIDTVIFSLPYDGSFIEKPYHQLITLDGEVLWKKSVDLTMPGRDNIHFVTITHDQVNKLLRIRCSPYGFLLGHNTFTGIDLNGVCRRVLLCLIRNPRFPKNLTVESWHHAILERVDVAASWRFSDDKEVFQILDKLAIQFASQRIMMKRHKTSLYWTPGKGNEYSMVLYAKADEMKNYRRRMKNPFYAELAESSNGLLRIELRLRQAGLKKECITDPSSWKLETPVKLYRKYFSRLPISNFVPSPIPDKVIKRIGVTNAQFLFLAWNTSSLKDHISPSKINRRSRDLRNKGIDYRCPPSKSEDPLQLADILSNRVAKPPLSLIESRRVPVLRKKLKPLDPYAAQCLILGNSPLR